MASMSLTSILTKSHNTGAMVVRNPWSSRGFVPVALRPFQKSVRHESVTTQACDKAADAAGQGTGELKMAGQEMKDKAASTAEDMNQKTKDTAGKVADTAQDLTEKAKQTAQDAWGSVKDTTQKIKETVVGKAEESKDSIKQNAEKVKREMDMKN
ncbi:hypothetical protein RHMOL_Rhmol01G0344700 [Rhododendron molle]|uniref:Uncharacterized protein n=1 Tax=Rhododendron molle TaxID=49168 RepID=A0ACC0QC59_RHOML|nr:hypothetical protein RHMOL_Rhmol01G0344700 [Rhododendron molle]